MGQSHWAVYLLPGEPNVYVYTTTKRQNVKDFLEVLGFKYQHTLYAYGWACKDGHMYSLPQYFSIEDKDRMLRLVRINNGTDAKIRETYKEIQDAQTVERKRWWEYYNK